MEPSEKDTESPLAPQVTEPEVTAEGTAQPPAAEEPVPEDLISREVEQKLTVEDAEPPVPVAPDLDAVEPTYATGGTATNLDLPSIELPHPAYPEPQQAPPAAAYQTPGQAYGQTTPYAVPEPPPAPAYGQQFSQPGYAQEPAYTPQPGYTPQGGYAPQYSGQQLAYPAGQLTAADENVWSGAAHWSAILASFVGLGFLGPLIILLTQGTKSPRVRANAVESLNFEITFIIAMIASVLLIFLVVGIVTSILIPLAWLILRIIASVQASSGQDYRYPVNIRLVK